MIEVNEFKKEVREWAQEMNLSPKEIRVKKLSARWGYCNTHGSLIFSSELLNQSEVIRAEAIVHELLHLKYPNHGKMFNTLLKAYLSRKGFQPSKKE